MTLSQTPIPSHSHLITNGTPLFAITLLPLTIAPMMMASLCYCPVNVMAVVRSMFSDLVLSSLPV